MSIIYDFVYPMYFLISHLSFPPFLYNSTLSWHLSHSEIEACTNKSI